MLLRNISTVFTQDSDRSVHQDVDIRISDARFDAIGPDLSGTPVIDCSGYVALPGLVNTHTHTPTLLTRGLADTHRLFPWLSVNDRWLTQATRREKTAAARISAAMALRTGTTMLNDMSTAYLADTLLSTGLRVGIGPLISDISDMTRTSGDEADEATTVLLNDDARHPRLHPMVAVHSTYRSSRQTIEVAHELAAMADVPMHIHVSETDESNRRCLNRHGIRPVALLDEIGVLNRPVLLAHCVQLTDSEWTRLRTGQVGVGHCISANLKLGSGVADVDEMNHLPTGLGTDGIATNNTLNLFREARTAALTHKRQAPYRMPAQRVFDMITCDAAAALNLDDTIGSIEPGKRADLVLVNTERPPLRPAASTDGLLSNLIYSYHGYVDTVLIDGEIVVNDGEVRFDLAADLRHAQAFQTAVAEHRST